jgi:hypothetical protein
MPATIMALGGLQTKRDSMTTPNDLSDKALAVFAFAIYHQLNSGDVVTGIVARDEAGHQADRGALEELKKLELANVDAGKIIFTPAGELMLQQLIDRLRGAW